MSFEKLDNPPIREAIFDIRADLDKQVSLEDLGSFGHEVNDSFPYQEIKINLQSNIEIKSQNEIPETMKLEHSKEGFLYRSQDGNKVVQARLDGFTFSVTKDYQSWDSFFSQASDLWSVYQKFARPVKITRLALRYINSVLLDVDPKDGLILLEDYLRVFPEVNDELGVTLGQTLLRLQIVSEEFTPSEGILTEVVTPRDANGKFSLEVLLDIDVFQSSVDISPDDTRRIHDVFSNNLRMFKNKVFFNTLTPKTLELIS